MRRRVISKELEHGSYPCTCDILCIASVVLQPNTAFEFSFLSRYMDWFKRGQVVKSGSRSLEK